MIIASFFLLSYIWTIYIISHATASESLLLFLLKECPCFTLSRSYIFRSWTTVNVWLCAIDKNFCQLQKCCFDILPGLSTAFVYFDTAAPSEFCNLCIAHFWLNADIFFTLIDLISNDNDLNVSLAMFLDLGQPNIQICKALLLEQVEAQNDPFCTFVIGVCDSSIALLSCSVPNLQLYLAPTVVNWTESEVYSDRSWIVFYEVVISKAD